MHQCDEDSGEHMMETHGNHYPAAPVPILAGRMPGPQPGGVMLSSVSKMYWRYLCISIRWRYLRALQRRVRPLAARYQISPVVAGHASPSHGASHHCLGMFPTKNCSPNDRLAPETR